MKTWLSIVTVMTACSAAKPVAVTPKQTSELAGRRAQMIGWLHDYAEAGVYPTDASGMPLSVFRDDKGVRCPMAELIHKSGRDDLVEAVVKEDNAVRLGDVHEGPLHDWMLGSGLTEDEIAMVQGAMSFNEIRYEELLEQPRLVAQGEVRGRIEMAEAALRVGTSSSINIASAKLPHERDVLANATPVNGKVVPAAAIKPVTISPAVVTRLRRLQGVRGVGYTLQ
jgi:hypothetical protein